MRLRDLNFNDPEKKKKFNKELFNVVAPKYDQVTRWLSFGRDRAWKRKMLKVMPGEGISNVLDLACGTGDITQGLLKRYPQAYIWGLDLNEAMLKIARKRIPLGQVQFLLKDMNQTGFETGSLDLVTGSYALRNAPDIGAALFEVYRVLKKGGKAYFLDFSKSPWKIVAFLQLKMLYFWGSLWGWLLHRNKDIYAYLSESLAFFPDRGKLHQLCLEVGFKSVSSKKFFFGFIELLVLEK